MITRTDCWNLALDWASKEGEVPGALIFGTSLYYLLLHHCWDDLWEEENKMAKKRCMQCNGSLNGHHQFGVCAACYSENVDAEHAALPKNTAPEPPTPPEPVDLTDEQIDAICGALNDWAVNIDSYEYGLPLHDEAHYARARFEVRKALGAPVSALETWIAANGNRLSDEACAELRVLVGKSE